MYTLSKKQLSALNRGERVKIALPPPPQWIEGLTPNRLHLNQWLTTMFAPQLASLITDFYLANIWLDMSDPKGGLTQFLGKIVPDITKHSPHCLPPTPTTVVVVELSPPNAKRDAERIQWPATYTNTLGYEYASDGGDW